MSVEWDLGFVSYRLVATPDAWRWILGLLAIDALVSRAFQSGMGVKLHCLCQKVNQSPLGSMESSAWIRMPGHNCRISWREGSLFICMTASSGYPRESAGSQVSHKLGKLLARRREREAQLAPRGWTNASMPRSVRHGMNIRGEKSEGHHGGPQ